jgi:hypothetical protein
VIEALALGLGNQAEDVIHTRTVIEPALAGKPVAGRATA